MVIAKGLDTLEWTQCIWKGKNNWMTVQLTAISTGMAWAYVCVSVDHHTRNHIIYIVLGSIYVDINMYAYTKRIGDMIFSLIR